MREPVWNAKTAIWQGSKIVEKNIRGTVYVPKMPSILDRERGRICDRIDPKLYQRKNA
jgi:hypothetical protein